MAAMRLMSRTSPDAGATAARAALAAASAARLSMTVAKALVSAAGRSGTCARSASAPPWVSRKLVSRSAAAGRMRRFISFKNSMLHQYLRRIFGTDIARRCRVALRGQRGGFVEAQRC